MVKTTAFASENSGESGRAFLKENEDYNSDRNDDLKNGDEHDALCVRRQASGVKNFS